MVADAAGAVEGEFEVAMVDDGEKRRRVGLAGQHDDSFEGPAEPEPVALGVELVGGNGAGLVDALFVGFPDCRVGETYEPVAARQDDDPRTVGESRCRPDALGVVGAGVEVCDRCWVFGLAGAAPDDNPWPRIRTVGEAVSGVRDQPGGVVTSSPP